MCGGNQQVAWLPWRNPDPKYITEVDALSFNINQIYAALLSLRKPNPRIHPILSSNISTAQTQKAKVLCWGFSHPQRRILRHSIKHLTFGGNKPLQTREKVQNTAKRVSNMRLCSKHYLGSSLTITRLNGLHR